MATETNAATYTGPRLLGAPVGDFSLLQTLLFIFAATLGGLFTGTFAGIVGLGIYGAVAHKIADFSLSYKYVGLPLGVLMLLASTLYLGTLYARRVLRRA